MLRFLLKRSFAFCVFFVSVFFTGCFYEDMYYENADTDYSIVNYHDLSGNYPLIARILEGKIDIPLNAFVPNKVSLTVLDSSLQAVDSLDGTIVMHGDMIEYKFPINDYIYPYVKIAVEGRWRTPYTAEEIVSFETISDISDVESPRVSLMTHVEILMLERLVREGYPFLAAKRKSMRDMEKALLFSLDSVALPTESLDRAYDEVAFVYAFLMRDGRFKKNLNAFCKDLTDASLDDSVAIIEFADFIISEWLSVDSLLNKMNNRGSTKKWNYFENFVERAYGLGACKIGDVVTIGVEKSKFYGDSLVCDYVYNAYFFRRFLENEKHFGPCVKTRSLPYLEIRMDSDSLFFACNHNDAQYGLSEDSIRLEFKNDWYEADYLLVRNYYLGTCDREFVNQKARYLDSIFVCTYNSTYKEKFFWKNEGTDTLSYFMGECNSNNLWEIKLFKKMEYVCTLNSWMPANDSLLFLSKLRPCDKKIDSLRSFSYNSVYYVCDDVKIDSWHSLYTFKDTTKFVSDSLSFIASLKPCEKEDSLRYVYDSTYNRFYHCAIKKNVLKYYDANENVARPIMCDQFVETIEHCHADSDTLAIIYCPYNESQGTRNNNRFYHCVNRNGAFRYEVISYSDYPIYKSFEESKNSTLCEGTSDKLRYVKDRFGYYYYCAESNNSHKITFVNKNDLVELLTEEFVNNQETCDSRSERWRILNRRILNDNYYFVCDYDGANNFRLIRGDEWYARAYSVRQKTTEPREFWGICRNERIYTSKMTTDNQDGYIIDSRDGHRYRVVTIGNQIWMAENLNYYDTLITPNLKESTSCSVDENECNETGRLYLWNALANIPRDYLKNRDKLKESLCAPIQGICPEGWHIPSLDEWSMLFVHVMNHNDYAGYGVGLKASKGWAVSPKNSDLFAFSASPVTWTSNKYSYFASANADFSVDSVFNSYAVRFRYDNDYPDFYVGSLNRSYSVRCVKD